jgi:hypothetical protein
MRKVVLNNNPKAEHKSDDTVLMGAQEAGMVNEDRKNEWLKKQFAQDALIHQRVKCPVAAMVFCLMHRV